MGLEAWVGANASIYKYDTAHRKLRLILTLDGEQIQVICVGCTRISGPFSWEKSHLLVSPRISAENASVSDSVILSDTLAGFSLECSDVVLTPANPYYLDE